MRRALHLPLAAALGVLCALLVACGGSNAQLIPSSDADELKSSLTALREAVDDRDCAAVETRVEALRSDIANLPGAVSPKLRSRLKGESEDKLIPEARRACDDSKTETIPTQTETQQTEQTPPPATTSTQETQAAPPATQPPATVPPEVPDEEEPVDPVVPEEPVDPGAGDDAGGFGTEGDG